MSAERKKMYVMFFWIVLTQLYLCADFFLSVCFYFLCLAKTIKLEIESFIDLKKICISCCKGFYCERQLSEMVVSNTVL